MPFLDLFKKSKKGSEREKIEKNKIVVFLIPDKTYQEELLRIAKSAANVFNRTLYLSLNKPAEYFIDMFKQNSINVEKFLFVDAVSKEIKSGISDEGVIFVDSPKDLGKFDEELSHVLEKEEFECLIFDSLSTLLIYHDDNATVRFIHDLITRIRMHHAGAEFICLLEDVNSTLVKDISMFADEIVNLGREKTKIKEGELRQERIAKLEKELMAIEQAHNSQLISEQSYLNSKERINKNLRKLRK